MTEFRGNENEEKALFFVPRVGCIEECQWHSEGTGLSTRAIGHPLPVPSYARGRSVWRNDRVPEGGRADTGGTSGAELPEGETREWRRTVRTRLTGWLLMLRDEGGGGASCDVDAGRWRRSKVAKSASVHQSRERRWAGNTFLPIIIDEKAVPYLAGLK
ncbi:hypothetical protein SAMN05216587_101912 [Selenomonas ruminantium]|uniref:Uncharacterized protein n=1 Tax=Selenomonas ruminantium TaxID=971 RepID=A0A1I0VSQ3_SELRU|nr:hypothetical protein SAMN05216587_101912 [Selenomonas ruminantium]